MCQNLFNDKIALEHYNQLFLPFFFKAYTYKNTTSVKGNDQFPFEFVGWFINKEIYCFINEKTQGSQAPSLSAMATLLKKRGLSCPHTHCHGKITMSTQGMLTGDYHHCTNPFTL